MPYSNHVLLLPLLLTLTLLLPIHPAHATYTLQQDYTRTPSHFFSSYQFFTSPDPTHGPTTYVDFRTAAAAHLIGWTSSNTTTTTTPLQSYKSHRPSSILLRTLPPFSTRLTSHISLSPGSLLVASITHLPTGCGVWPALWLLGGSAPWPDAGEVDVVEGVNLGARNTVSLHTSAGCVVRNGSDAGVGVAGVGGGEGEGQGFWGTMVTDDCYVDAAGQSGNAGCGIVAPAPAPTTAITDSTNTSLGPDNQTNSTNEYPYATFGPQFNAQGGGVYILEWPADNSGFSVWFFPSSSLLPSSPSSTSSSTTTSSPSSAPQTLQSLLTHPATAQHIHPDPATFGVPLARFVSAGANSTSTSSSTSPSTSGGGDGEEGCDFSTHFSALQIVLNTALCGDWAGNPAVWAAEQEDGGESCAVRTGFGTCEEWVASGTGDGEAWAEAFWEVSGLWVFGEGD